MWFWWVEYNADLPPKRQSGAAAEHLLKPLTAQRCGHRLNDRTIEPLNQKSQITQEYGLQARRVDSVEGGSFMFWEVFFSARGASL